jgi:hypothetical protein
MCHLLDTRKDLFRRFVFRLRCHERFGTHRSAVLDRLHLQELTEQTRRQKLVIFKQLYTKANKILAIASGNLTCLCLLFTI